MLKQTEEINSVISDEMVVKIIFRNSAVKNARAQPKLLQKSELLIYYTSDKGSIFYYS
jgi:hypothetical protein